MQPCLEGFPWSEAKGLCKVLRDPSIWSSVFTGEDRHKVKRAAKKAVSTRNSPAVKILKVTDDHTFGSVVVSMLTSRSGRRELAREFDNLQSFIAQRLYDRQINEHKDRIPRFDIIFEKRTSGGWQFVLANLEAWLTGRKITPEDQRILSLYVCYLALREPEQARTILEVFVNHDGTFLNWLSDEEAFHQPSFVPVSQPLPEAATVEVQHKPQDITAMPIASEVVPNNDSLPSPTLILPSDSAELVRLLTSSSDWDRDLSVDQFRSAVDLLARKMTRHADRLRDYDETHRRVFTRLKEAALLPWLECPLSIDQYLSLPLDISVEGALQHFVVVEQEAFRLLQLHSQLEMQVFKLGRQPFPCVSHEVTNLKEIAAYLEDYVTSLEEELQTISLRENKIVRFFDRFVELDQWDGLHLLETTEPTLWVDIVGFMLASRPITDAGRRYEQLIGRLDLAGLVVAYLWSLNAEKAIEIVGSIVSNKQTSLSHQQLVEALVYLTFAQLQQLMAVCTNSISDAARTILVAASGSKQRDTSLPLPADFGQRCTVDKAGDVIVLHARELVQPTMIQSWPVAVTKGAVPLRDLLFDHLRHILGLAPVSLYDAVQEFLWQKELLAARYAASEDPELQQLVEATVEKKRSAILKSHEQLLKRAQDVQDHDEYIALCLIEIDSAFAALDFEQAVERLRELDSLINDFERLRDPARVELSEFLEKAGLSVESKESLEELRLRTETLRGEQRERRLHLLELERVSQDGRLPPLLRESWLNFAHWIDRPNFWPSEENSRLLVDAIKTFVRFIVGKLCYRDDDPETVDSLVQRLGEWVVIQLQIGLTARDDEGIVSFHSFVELAQKIEEYAPDGHILRLISTSSSTSDLPQSPTEDVEQLPPITVEEDKEQGAEVFQQPEEQYQTKESWQVDEERLGRPKNERKRLEPINRGGRSRIFIPSGDRKLTQETVTREPKPELICWKRSRQWILAVEVPKIRFENSERKVLQNERGLEEDESREGCWPLEQVDCPVVVQWIGDGVPREVEITPSENGYLLFKLNDQQNQGRLVKSPSTGSYLVVVPEDWERDEAFAGPPLWATEPVAIDGYQAHFFLLEKSDDKKIAFSLKDNPPVVIEPKVVRFELVGMRLLDANEDMGPLFGEAPPKIRAADSKTWEAVGTIVVGEEGSGKGKWRKEFLPDLGKVEQDLPPKVAARKGGWYFLRIYDRNGDLIESMDFRFVSALKEIRVPQLSPVPSVDGHNAARVEFLHESGWSIHPIDDPASNITLETQANKTTLSIPSDSTYDRTRWLVGLETSPQVEVTILVERLWWTIGEEQQQPSTWQDRVLLLSRGDLRATSTKALWIKLPKRRWTNMVAIGFTYQGSRSYSVKVIEETVAIPLRDFGDTWAAQNVGKSLFQLWIETEETTYECTLCELVIEVRCKLCDSLASSEEDLFHHIESQHLDELFLPLTYQELQAFIPNLPAKIYRCPYCSTFVRSDDPANPTSTISRHMEKDCEKVNRKQGPVHISFDVVSDVDKIRANVFNGLPHIYKCTFCSSHLKEISQEEKLQHLSEKHKSELYQLY